MSKTRYAIHYENRLGRNDGNPLYVYSALKRKQDKEELEIDHVIPDTDLKPELMGTYDAHIWVDWGEDGLTELLPYKPIYPPGSPLVYWASDTHLGYKYRLECAKKADIVFVAQKRALEEFKKDGVDAIWLPHAVEPYAYADIDSVEIPKDSFTSVSQVRPYTFASKKNDVCFVGHINSGNRIDALDRMFKEFPKFFYGQRLFNQAAEVYARSKVSFNISMLDDINMRCFEIMGAGGLLLTNWLPTIEELGFKDGENCLLYKDLDDAVKKAKWAIDHDEERDIIAQKGYEFVMANHTIDHRVDKILQELNQKKPVLA